MPAAANFPTSCTPLRNVSIGLLDLPAIAIILRYVAAARVVNVAQEMRIAVSKQNRQTLSISEWLKWGTFSMAIKREEQGRNDLTICTLSVFPTTYIRDDEAIGRAVTKIPVP